MDTGCPAPMQQPALLRLADVLFCADAVLRTGVWASLELGPARRSAANHGKPRVHLKKRSEA
jgi:hypothetical protein